VFYEFLKNTLESTFAIQSLFKDEFSDIHYDLESQNFIIENQTSFTNKITNYLNNDNKTIDEKLYLAKVMQMQHSSLEFNIDEIVQAIDNNITKELTRYVYIGNEVTLFENNAKYEQAGLLVTSNEDETITIGDADNKIYLNRGDDKLISGKGNNIFYYNKGDGIDTIYDKGGADRLMFGEGITRENVEIQLNRNADLIIAIKEDGKTFDELSDKVIIVDWMKSANRVESVEFADGSNLAFTDVFEQFEGTDRAEVLQLSSGKNYKSGNSIDAIYLDGYKIVNIEKLFNTPTISDDDLALGTEYRPSEDLSNNINLEYKIAS